MDLGYRIGIDVGGTFTDFALVRPDGSIAVTKAPTTTHDEAGGVLAGLTELAEGEGRSLTELLGQTDALVHATTTADNTLIEGSGTPTGLITTAGHRDEIEFRRGWREKIWDPLDPPPRTLAKRRFRLGVAGRFDYQGNELVPLDEEAVRRAARRFHDHEIRSIAVVLLFSFVDSSHEKRVAEILAEEAPDAHVYLSHEVMPSAAEYERTSTTLVNAYVGPRVVQYLRSLQQRLREQGYRGDLLIMQSNGGITNASAAESRPIVTLASGPAAGVTATAAVGRTIGVESFISVDMGGTSYDVALVKNGRPVVKSSWNWISRHCIALPIVDVLSIGAGGGSIAKVKAGTLNVGPESAGSDPGPICYGRGGTLVTVTDANLLLGYLGASGLCGGRVGITREGVEEAMREQIAEPLAISVLEAAYGIHRLTLANMNNAIHRVSSERGHDPRHFDLVAFGGNGPMHATGQALDLGVERVLIPRLSPVLSAFGTLCTDFVEDRVHAHIAQIDEIDLDAVNVELAAMREDAAAELARVDVPADEIELTCEVECRYPGQTFTLTVPTELADGTLPPGAFEAVDKRFHQLHEELHTFATPEEPVVVAEIKLRSTGRAPKPALPEISSANTEAARKGSRPAYFHGEMVDTPLYDGALLGAGATITGPAIIEESFTTVLVHPEQRSTVDAYGNHLVTKVGSTS